MTRFVQGECKCGNPHPRIDTLIGRTDDMIKVKGVNIFPGQIDDILKEAEGVSSEYQVMIDHLNGRDIMTLFVEGEKGIDKAKVETDLKLSLIHI